MRDFIIALRMFLVLTVLTGVLYPLVITGLAQSAFRGAANGSLIEKDGKIVGSSLVGQSFTDPTYFWGRPSATGPFPYSAASSSGSNQGPLHPDLIAAIADRVAALKAADPDNNAPIPTDLVTASSSGLDPHISVAAAEHQVSRVARLRGLPPESVRQLVAQHTTGRQLGVLGEPIVNVLELNLALDEAK